jgi:hypothetical protein
MTATDRRISVNLTPRALKARDDMLERGSATSITDAICSSLILTDWIERMHNEGAELVLRRKDGTEVTPVLL